MMKGFNEVNSTVSFFYDGNPVPELLTEEEAIKFLRLDDGATKNPATTLQYYRTEGLLRPTRVGKKLRYLRSELFTFLDVLTQRTKGEIS